MTPLVFILAVFAVAVAAGLLGSMLGLGGGIIVVPALTLAFGVPIRFAIGASIVSVIATSTGAAAAYVRERLTNLRLAMLLEVATTAGALGGAYLAGVIPPVWLQRIFAFVLVYTAVAMWLKKEGAVGPIWQPRDLLADRLRLHGAYYDPSLQREVSYEVRRTRVGLCLSTLAGAVSGMLGLGGGVLKVPVMTLAMNVPMKAATATSNFMIGVTAAASAGVYFLRGDIDPFVAAPVLLGVTVGATVGSRLLGRTRGSLLRGIFVVLLVFLCVQMVLKAGSR